MQSLDQSEIQEQSIHDALLATCMLLNVQSTFISDGLEDYMIIGRGIGLLTQRMSRYETIDEWQLNNLRAYVDRSFCSLDPRMVDFRVSQAAALAPSVASLQHSCITAEEKAFCTGMQKMARWVQQPDFRRPFHPGQVATMMLIQHSYGSGRDHVGAFR